MVTDTAEGRKEILPKIGEHRATKFLLSVYIYYVAGSSVKGPECKRKICKCFILPQMLSGTAEPVSAFADVRNTGRVMARALLMILEMLVPLSKVVMKRLGRLCTQFVLFHSFP